LYCRHCTHKAQSRVHRFTVQIRRPSRCLLHLRCQFEMSVLSSITFPNTTLLISHTNSIAELPNFTAIHPRCALFECLLTFKDRASVRSIIAVRIVNLVNPLNPELNPICYLLALLGAHHFLHVSRIRVKLLTFRLLMSYIYIYIWSTHS